jgi:hypothetical protein
MKKRSKCDRDRTRGIATRAWSRIAPSKRRQAIEEAARIHGYSTPKEMELATLRTRRPKRDARLGELIKHWQAEAKTIGFELGQSSQHVQTMVASSSRPRPTRSSG